MRKLGIAIGSVLLFAGILITAYKLQFPDYPYKYRLVLVMQVDGKVYSGTSVIEVVWRGQPSLSDVVSYSPHVGGQATFVYLGPRGAIIAALQAGASSQDLQDQGVQDGAVDAAFLVPRAFGLASRSHRDLRRLTHLSGRANLRPGNSMPRLIWFSDIANMKTARKIEADDIPALFGSNARLADAYVTITNEPVQIGIDKALPWYETLKGLGDGSIEIQPGFRLTSRMFIGENAPAPGRRLGPH